ncbi:MAG: damage-inducible protein DinB [Paenibacillus sp.]|jgi:uncharacterized damage-inducible protein DinB|nr:damage-inducible protein DinB [Paenibacillus sp.]
MKKQIEIFNYHVWATKQITGHLKQLPGDVYGKQVQSVFSSIAEALGHIYRVDRMWLAVITGESFESIFASIPVWAAEVEGITLEEMEGKLQESFDRYLSFLGSQDDPEKEILLNHPQYGSRVKPLSDVLRHVFNHGTYHRGNITAMLRQMGHSGVSTDYIFYLFSLNDTE